MSATLVAAVAVLAIVVAALLGLVVERRRQARRFARKISPYERDRPPGAGQILDPDEWTRR